MVRLTMVKGMI